MHRSEHNIESENAIDYKLLYLQEKRLKEEFKNRAEIAEVKNRKLFQVIKKKCLRCHDDQEIPKRSHQTKDLKEFNLNIEYKNDKMQIRE